METVLEVTADKTKYRISRPIRRTLISLLEILEKIINVQGAAYKYCTP
jgi:hypothetical protein